MAVTNDTNGNKYFYFYVECNIPSITDMILVGLVLLRYTDSDCPFGIFKFFFLDYRNMLGVLYETGFAFTSRLPGFTAILWCSGICCFILIWFDLIFGVKCHFQQYFSYIMATSFSGGRSRSTRRELPTMGKQLVNFITCGCESSAHFFVIYIAGREPTPYWW